MSSFVDSGGASGAGNRARESDTRGLEVLVSGVLETPSVFHSGANVKSLLPVWIPFRSHTGTVSTVGGRRGGSWWSEGDMLPSGFSPEVLVDFGLGRDVSWRVRG
jgi:hypothetical protein